MGSGLRGRNRDGLDLVPAPFLTPAADLGKGVL